MPLSHNAPTVSVLLVVACALLDRQGRVLLAERPAGKNLAGLWEFPGGKVETGETPEAALQRELWEEIGIKIKIDKLQPLSFVSHSYDNFHLLMPLYLCQHYEGQVKPCEGQRLQWAHIDELANYPMPPADRPLIIILQNLPTLLLS